MEDCGWRESSLFDQIVRHTRSAFHERLHHTRMQTHIEPEPQFDLVESDWIAQQALKESVMLKQSC
jgi:hypothetical protein